jgi:hypothetical protein
MKRTLVALAVILILGVAIAYAQTSGMTGRGMMGVENPSEDGKKFIAAYLRDHSLRFVSPNMLPLPESKGAVLFKTICSQCHALPDPSSHMAQDWPAVIKRMRGNMQSMGKRPIDEKEEIEILKYLTEHARQ